VVVQVQMLPDASYIGLQHTQKLQQQQSVRAALMVRSTQAMQMTQTTTLNLSDSVFSNYNSISNSSSNLNSISSLAAAAQCSLTQQMVQKSVHLCSRLLRVCMSESIHISCSGSSSNMMNCSSIHNSQSAATVLCGSHSRSYVLAQSSGISGTSGGAAAGSTKTAAVPGTPPAPGRHCSDTAPSPSSAALQVAAPLLT
jgi:hypothetical protein